MKRWALGFILLCFIAVAQQSPLELKLERFVITQVEQDGEMTELRAAAFESRPGDVIEEVLTATNLTAESLTGVALEIPVPLGSSYLADTASVLELESQSIVPQFSFDNGSSFAYAPLYKTITVLEDGKEVTKEVIVDPSEYTHVRWLVPQFSANAELTASFRAVVR
ncbi:MAG: hypothetical protein KC422_18060 [Trueperaceae bacterium]|nr:hypothetical protein [Trueperaceae bacterium]